MPLPLLTRALAALVGLSALLGGALPVRADELIVDNTHPSVQVVGNWSTTTTTPGFQGSDYRFRVPGDGSATVRWPFPANAPAGRYEVFASWSAGPNRATNATFRVSHAGGAVTVGVNQKVGGGAWQPLGSFEFQPGRDHGVLVHDRADGVVVADAIRWVGPLGGPATPATSPSPSATATPTGQQGAATVSPVGQTPGPAAPTATPPPVPGDPRYFEQTRYRISENAFWDYFQKRGGVRTFGYPVSNTFVLLGMKVQVFQRQVMQLRPDGAVQTLNLLDEGLLPVTRVNGSTYPAPDADVIRRAPRPDDPEYLDKALQFVRDLAPDEMDGQPVGFARTFFSTVRAEDAFPGGVPEGGEYLLPGFNLEIWGLPTSRPAYEPTNRNFIYQRFQRGIMHFDRGCDCTQGVLLADHFKAVAINRDLPSDLAAQVRGNRLFAQWAPMSPLGLARPNELPGSNWLGAFRRDPIVVVDAGHGGREIGASHTYPDGVQLLEKNLNLRVAQRIREILERELGYQVVTTRTTDAGVNADGRDLTGDGKVNISDDLQARVDLANRVRADVLLSVHFNGSTDPAMRGTFTFYNAERPYGDRNRALAESIQAGLVKAIREAGYQTLDRGVRTDTSALSGGYYFLLSPRTEIVSRPSEMPAVIGEALFLTSVEDAAALRNDRVVEAIARGYVEGLRAYLTRFPPP